MNSNLRNFGHLFHQEGTAQDERFLPALDPGKILLDDRRLKDLLLYIQRLSGYVLFSPGGDGMPEPGEAEKADGMVKAGVAVKAGPTWREFLQKDIAILLADVAACSVEEIRQAYRLLEGEFNEERTMDKLERLIGLVFSLFEKLDRWYEKAVAESAGSRLTKDLRLYIQSYLAKKLADLYQIRLHAEGMWVEEERKALPVYIFRNNDGVWGDFSRGDKSYGERVFTGGSDDEKLLNASIRLKEIYDIVVHVLEQVVGSSGAYLEETLHAKKDHQPHIGLMITFLELYGYARDEINKIPQRHLDFYYGQILAIGRRKAVPDCAFVNFELGKGFGSYQLKKGSLLSAGKDALNKDMVYATTRDIVVNNAKVHALRTLFIDKDDKGRVAQYYPSGRDLPAAGEAQVGALSLFGDKMGVGGTTGTAGTTGGGDKMGAGTGVGSGRVGFAIASGQFYLAKGNRHIVLRFELEKDLAVETPDGSLLELWLTGEKGWLSSARADDGILINSFSKPEDRMLELDFTVSIAQASAIVAFNPKIHDGGFDTDLPMLQVLLRYPPSLPGGDSKGTGDYQDALVQLDALQKIRPVDTIITVQVGNLTTTASFDGVRDLSLQNHEAVLDAKKPFFPFTSVPKVGSSFYIGCDDLFYKPIQKLTVNMEWMLPDKFQSYYNKYMPPYDSNRFRASLSILQNKKWRKLVETSTIDIDSKDPRWRAIKIDLASADRGGVVAKEDTDGGVARFDPEKMNGTLKLKLLYPDFGHGVYAQLITSTVMEKASSGAATPDFYKLIRHELHDSEFSIKLPPGPGQRAVPYKVVVYDVLEGDDPDDKARSMMIKGLSGVIRDYNERYIEKGVGQGATGPGTGAATAAPMAEPEDQRMIVNNESRLERILRKFRIIPSIATYGRQRETVGQAAEEIKEKIVPVADFILPDKRELADIIDKVTDSAIYQTSIKVADRLLELRKKGIDGSAVEKIFREEFEEANKVLNDMIAGKIAAILMAAEMPPSPYTPVINMISVNYQSSRSCNEVEDRFFRVSPFGHAVIEIGDVLFEEAVLRTPSGQLYIGLGECEPGQELSLLFRFAEGTGRTDKTPPGIQWKYLSGNDWKLLPEDCMVADGTYGLQTTGILQLSLPLQANNKTSLFDVPGLCWLCASVTGSTDAFPGLDGIDANAVLVCFKDQGNDIRHGATPLPAGRLQKLADKVPAIKKVNQPLASFGGRVMEEEKEYYTRVSERLRHKSRAVNSWDYERLVLENFPEVFKVKCLNDYRDGRFVRGHVTVTPLCDLQNRADTCESRLTPRASFALLRSIEQFLAKKTSSFVQVHAINPQLSHVLIRCRVKFNKGIDKGYALLKLEKDLVRFLTPWAGKDVKLNFSTKIYASNVISYIGEREEVDYVEGFEMLQYTENENGDRIFCRAANQDIALVETQFINGHTLLVSAPAHRIELIE